MSTTVQPNFRGGQRRTPSSRRALSDFKQKTFVTGWPQLRCQLEVSFAKARHFVSIRAGSCQCPPNPTTPTIPFAADLAEREKAMIENALREAEGLISGPAGAAAKLGLPRQTLESKIRKLGIDWHRSRTS
jgi:transcriptional regulator with GAF, ATPase, and Fis domain